MTGLVIELSLIAVAAAGTATSVGWLLYRRFCIVYLAPSPAAQPAVMLRAPLAIEPPRTVVTSVTVQEAGDAA